MLVLVRLFIYFCLVKVGRILVLFSLERVGFGFSFSGGVGVRFVVKNI